MNYLVSLNLAPLSTPRSAIDPFPGHRVILTSPAGCSLTQVTDTAQPTWILLLLLPFSVQGSVFRRIDALLGEFFLEWAVESTTVTHSSADWWGLLLPLA